MAAASPETYVFQAEINQLMSLIVNAFYSNKEIFLRELIANASDAMDKFRHEALEKHGAVNDVQSLQIKITADKTNNILTIEDNGIGMSKQDMIDNLGTIARSGTKAFMEAVKDQKDLSLIGQFGVGFYSAFLVADRVRVTSQRRGTNEPTYIWESTAGGSFTIAIAEEATIAGGTRIELVLKTDQTEFLEEKRIRDIVNKHSSFITYPISLQVTREREVEVKDTETPDEAPKAPEDGVIEEVEATADAEKPKNTRKEEYQEWEQLNKQKPIWMRKPDEVEQDEYNAFYKAVTNDWEDPLAQKHFSVEGQLEFKGLLFLPRRAPFDLFGREKRNNMKLYVRRVFITDNSEELVPEWLSFVKGLVDSDDLPLNVSRELLQQNKVMKVIQKNVVKKCIELLTDLATDKPDDYKTFYDNFSRNVKLGVYEDDNNRDKLVELLRFASTNGSAAEHTSLKDYVTRMKEKQESIYFITGESLAQVQASPFLERLTKLGYEVLFMVDPIDEYAMQRVREYKDKKMVCITKEGALKGLDDLDEDAKKARDEAFKPTIDAIKEILGAKVEKVALSNQISSSPAVLVTSEYAWSANMERIMKAQALSNNSQMTQYMAGKRSLEINPDHKIIKAIQERIAKEKTVTAPTKDLINMLYETSLLNSGFNMEDPTVFVRRIHRLMELGLNLDEEEQKEVPDDSPSPQENSEIETKMEELD